MKSIGTLRELFVKCDLMKVYTLLHSKHIDSNPDSSKANYSLNGCIDAYKNVIIQMMLKPVKKAQMPLHVSYENDSFGDENGMMYYHVCFLNPKYEAPPKGAKPWGGSNHPDGYYNVNLKKYNQYFAVVGNDWTQLVNADVVVAESATNAANEVLVAEILWEITFYGFSEKKADQFFKNLNKSLKKEKKSISKKKK